MNTTNICRESLQRPMSLVSLTLHFTELQHLIWGPIFIQAVRQLRQLIELVNTSSKQKKVKKKFVWQKSWQKRKNRSKWFGSVNSVGFELLEFRFDILCRICSLYEPSTEKQLISVNRWVDCTSLDPWVDRVNYSRSRKISSERRKTWANIEYLFE